MAEEKLKPENNNVTKQNDCDIEKQDNEKNLQQEGNNEPLEKIKEKPPRKSFFLVNTLFFFFCI